MPDVASAERKQQIEESLDGLYVCTYKHSTGNYHLYRYTIVDSNSVSTYVRTKYTFHQSIGSVTHLTPIRGVC